MYANHVYCYQGRHVRNRVSSCDFRKTRPMRIVTGGTEDYTMNLNSGPPFSFTKKNQDGHERGAIHAVKYIDGTNLVVSVGADKKICFWDGKTLDLVREQNAAHEGTIFNCDWGNDGEQVMTCSADGKVNFFNVSDGSLIKSLNLVSLQSNVSFDKIPFGGMQLGCAFLKNNIPVSVGVNGKIAVINDDRDDATFIEGHQFPIAALALDIENNHLYTGDSEGIICNWNLENGSSKRIKSSHGPDLDLMNKIHKGTITAMEYVGGTLLSCGWDDKLRSSTGEGSFAEIKLMKQPNAMAKGTHLVVVVMIDGVGLYKDGKMLSSYSEFNYNPLCAAVSRDDQTVCVGGSDNNIYVYSVNDDTLTLLKTITHHLKPIHSLSLSPNGDFLASADVRDICVWNTLDWSTIISKGRWCFHAQKISCLAWSPDSRILASASIDDNIYLWNLKKKMKRINYTFCHRGGITGLVWRNEEAIVTSGSDCCVCEWNVAADIKKQFG